MYILCNKPFHSFKQLDNQV